MALAPHPLSDKVSMNPSCPRQKPMGLGVPFLDVQSCRSKICTCYSKITASNLPSVGFHLGIGLKNRVLEGMSLGIEGTQPSKAYCWSPVDTWNIQVQRYQLQRTQVLPACANPKLVVSSCLIPNRCITCWSMEYLLLFFVVKSI